MALQLKAVEVELYPITRLASDGSFLRRPPIGGAPIWWRDRLQEAQTNNVEFRLHGRFYSRYRLDLTHVAIAGTLFSKSLLALSWLMVLLVGRDKIIGS